MDVVGTIFRVRPNPKYTRINLLFNEFRIYNPPMDFSENDFFLIKERGNKIKEWNRIENRMFYEMFTGYVSDQWATFTRLQSDPISFFPPKIFKISHRIENFSGTLKLFIAWKRI